MSTTAIESKLKKSLARFKERIGNGSYYEAQQTIRSITNRYVHSKNYDAAISLLYQSTMILLENKQYDEAADLYSYMLEVFAEENKDISIFERDDLNKIISILSIFPDTDANLLNLSKETSKFVNTKVGNPIGLPKLNYLLGTKLYNSGYATQVNLSEKYLFLTEELSALDMLIDLEFNTYVSEGKDDFGLYLSRVILPYLTIKNIRFAELALNKMLIKYNNTSFIDVSDMKIFEASEDNDDNNLKLINFLQLLVALIKRHNVEDSNIFSLVLKRYQPTLKSYEGLFERINELAVIYYNISFIKKQANLLQGMMGSLLGGK